MVPTCSSGTSTKLLPHRNATGHDNPHCNSKQTQGRPVIVLSIDVERQIVIHNSQLPILMSWVRPDRKILPRPSTHTANAQIYDAVMVVVSQRLGRK